MPCETVGLPGRGTAIICGPRWRAKPCHYCGRRSSRLCDFPIVLRLVAGKAWTCDVPMCSACTWSPAPEKDYCRPHRAIVEESEGSAAEP